MSENKNVGTLTSGGTIIGGLGTVIARDGKSAYEIAVNNGFEGTEAQWLASLKGADGTVSFDELTEGQKESLKGDKGSSGVYLGSGEMPSDCNVQIDPDGVAVSVEQILEILSAKKSKISTATLFADNWLGTESPYSQVVAIDGVTENTQVDLTPDVLQLAIFHNKDLAFVTENDGGVVTVYAIGQKPTNDYTIQVTLTEVEI